MNVFQFAANAQAYFEAYEKHEHNYEVKTTFASDFAIAEFFAVKQRDLSPIKDTFNRAFNEWKNNIEYLTELTIVMNLYCWQHYNDYNDITKADDLREFFKTMSELYSDYYYKCRDYVYDNYSGNDINYFYNITD